MSDIELGSVISLIMENPELIAEIKRLAERKNTEDNQEAQETITEPQEKLLTKTTEETAFDKPEPTKRQGSKGKRSELLHALSPYISEGRQKALETFMTIADILDMMREK